MKGVLQQYVSHATLVTDEIMALENMIYLKMHRLEIMRLQKPASHKQPHNRLLARDPSAHLEGGQMSYDDR